MSVCTLTLIWPVFTPTFSPFKLKSKLFQAYYNNQFNGFRHLSNIPISHNRLWSRRQKVIDRAPDELAELIGRLFPVREVRTSYIAPASHSGRSWESKDRGNPKSPWVRKPGRVKPITFKLIFVTS